MHGFNWFLYFLFYNKFTERLASPPSDVFGFVGDQIDSWGGFNYADQIKNVALGIGGLFGQLPPAMIYLFSIGFSMIFIGLIMKIILEVI